MIREDDGFGVILWLIISVIAVVCGGIVWVLFQ